MQARGQDGGAGATDRNGSRPGSLWKGPAVLTALLLVIPLLGNQFVDGWNWEPRGFVLVGAILFGAGLTYKLVTRNVDTGTYRAAVGLTIGATLLLVWMNFVQAADDVNPDAKMYLVVPPVGLAGAILARLRARGMARALFVMAFVQVLVLAIVFARQHAEMTSWTSYGIRGFGANAMFAALFAGSALFFRNAARRLPARGRV